MSAACGELRGHGCFAWPARLYEIVQDAVRDGFVERALVAIRGEIEFQRFTLDAQTIRYVIDIDPGKIRLTCHRTDRSEIIRFKVNSVIALRGRIRKRLQARLGG